MSSAEAVIPQQRAEAKTASNFIEQARKTGKVAVQSAFLLVAGGVSNAIWVGSMAANKFFEAKNVDLATSSLAAVGIGFGSTALEFGLTYLGTAGKLKTDWEPRNRFTTWMKKAPFAATAWRGAATGAFLEQLYGEEVTPGRRLKHAALVGGIMTTWASKPGNYVLNGVIDFCSFAGSEIAERQTAVMYGYIGGLALTGVGMALNSLRDADLVEQDSAETEI